MIDRERVKELYLQGKKGTHIAAVLGCKPPTVWRIHRELQKAGELDDEGDGQTMPDEQPEPQRSATQAAQRYIQSRTPLAADPDILRQQKENELLRLQAERERLQREIQSRPTEVQAAVGGGEIGILRVELMGELRELRRDREQLMNAIRDLQRDVAGVVEKVGQTKEIDLSALQAAVGNNGDSLETTIPLVKKIIELGRELGGGGSGDGEDQSSIEKLGTTILSGIFSGRRVPAQPGMAPPTASTQQVDPMQARILSFIFSIEREAAALTDPWTIAEILEKELAVCPEPFRNLVLQNSPNAILAGLGRFVPQQIHARITGLMQQNPQARQWLDAFIEGLQGEEEVNPAEFEEQPAGAPPTTPQPPTSGAHEVGTRYTEEDLFGDPEEAFPTQQPHPGGGAVATGA